MEFHQIEAFLAVAEELHFGRAAARLNISQPPLSRTIRQLENELGTALFIRNTRSVGLSSAGESLLSPARTMLAARQSALQSVAQAFQGVTGRVRIGFSVASNHERIGALASGVRESFPGIELSFDGAAYASTSIERIISGSLDICMLRQEFLPETVESRVVAQEHFVMAIPREHRLAKKKDIRLKDFKNEDFVALPAVPGMVTRAVLDRHAHRAGFRPHYVQTATDSWTLMSLVAAGVGCSFTLSSIAESFKSTRVIFRAMADAIPPTNLRLVWDGNNLNPAVRSVLDVSKTILPTLIGAEASQ